MSKSVSFGTSSTLTAFETNTIGTKVLDPHKFYNFLESALANHDPSKDTTEGQHFIVLAPEAFVTVSTGVGRRTQKPEDYVHRLYRGRVESFLCRDLAAEVEGLAVVVYTRAAYLADPDINPEKVEVRFPGDEAKLVEAQAETARIESSDFTHLVVAVLAFAGPKAPLSPYRLVHNLAGGNADVEKWSKEDILNQAGNSKDYHDKWATVAD